MGNERKLRLIQVAKEFKVGLNTITDFLQKKGIKSDGSPNTLVDAETYAVLEKEFGANRAAGNARESIRERISLKQTTITLEEAKKQEREEEKEVVIKSNVISVKDEIQQPKFLGKIDLSPKPKAAPAPKAEAEKPAAQHPAAPAAPAPAQAPKAAAQPAPAPAPAVPEARPAQPAPATQASHAAPATPAPAAQAAPAEPAKPAAPATPAPTAQAPGQPDAKPAEAPAPAPEPAAPKDNIFRPETVTLTGPQVLGTMDVSGFVAGGKHKRKRLQKEKVDVSKAPRGNAQGGGNKQGGQGGQGGQNRPGQGGQNRPGAQNQPKPGEGRRNKNKGKAAPKPIVRPEVSDEEVSKQVKDTLARLTAKGAKSKSAKYRKDKRDAVAERMNEEFEREEQERSTLKVTEFVTVSELATMMNVSPTQVITACMNLGLMVSINQRLDAEALVVVAEEFGYKVEFVSVEIQEAINDEGEDKEEDLVPRPPIVTVMGHVDHGKTSLLDNIRKTNVIEGEAGGITQHIGAYSVELNGQKITFLDTPGHEAFTAMRARGAAVTDVAIIIVAADDSVMPQTIEAINHAQAAGVPMVFAINKIDKPNANPDHIKEQLSQMNYLVESWGGKYQDQEVSAKKGLNLDKLLEKVLLEAEMLDLKANPNRPATGAIIESTLDKGRGYVANVLVQNGTLHVGDIVLAGNHFGKVKAMFNERDQRIKEAGPATPALILGLNGAPTAGDTFNVMPTEHEAREIANKRTQLQREQGIRTTKILTLEDIGRRRAIGNFQELNIIVKGDVDGSIEALSDSLIKLSTEEIQVNVLHKAVGEISESDVTLAAASNAVIIGFQVRPSQAARRAAEREGVEIRLYSVIYQAIEEVKDAMAGMLAPEIKEEITGTAEVLETFKISKVGTIAGAIVREGKIKRSNKVRLIRDGIVRYTGDLGSLKRFKDDVKEVASGYDCGLSIAGYNDVQVGDLIEGFEEVEVNRTL